MLYYRFIRRHGFSIRRISHKGQTIPESFDKLKNSFIEEVIMKKKIYIFHMMIIVRLLIWTRHQYFLKWDLILL